MPADKRGEVVRFEEGFTVINDSYNSSPTASERAGSNCSRRRRDISGEFWPRAKCSSWGRPSSELHRECGRAVAELGKIDWIFGVRGYGAEIL